MRQAASLGATAVARNRVLVLAYFFPPVGGGTSRRNWAIVRHLVELGYRPTVVTGSGGADHYWAPLAESGAAESLVGVKISRVPGPEPEASRGLRRRIERTFDLQPQWYRWWLRGALEAGRTECASVDIVYAALEPYENAFVAGALAREFGKPWIAELMDPWALDEMRMHVSGLHRARDRRQMTRGLRTASRIVMSAPEAVARVQRELPELSGIPIEDLPLGFDDADFEGPPPRRDDETFRIVHTGFMHTRLGLRHRRTHRLRGALGGLYTEVDVLTRSHLYLLDALGRVVERHPDLRERVELHLAGSLTHDDRVVASRSPVPVREHGFLPHDQTIQLIRSADLLFLPMHELPDGRRAGLVPGKTYEYLASGRPILAAIPEGDARDLLLEAAHARLCSPSDVDAMTDAIEAEVERWRAGAAPAAPRADVVARYERGRIAERLATLLEAM